jgi:hypothetical protein
MKPEGPVNACSRMALPVLHTNKRTEQKKKKKDALSNHKSNLRKHSLLEN